MNLNNWRVITKDVNPEDPVLRSLYNEAWAAAPLAYTSKKSFPISPTTMLPRRPLKNKCRLCGRDSNLTKEHIPPGSSGNKGRHENYDLDGWLKSGFAHENVKLGVEQGGIFGYTLCRRCNSLTGRLYGKEYKEWTERAKGIITGFGPGTVAQLDQSVGPFGWKVTFGSKESGSVKPGAFVRQILSCMCSLSGAWNLAGQHPEIRRIVLEQSVERLSPSLDLGMSLYLGPKVRIMGPQLKIDFKTKTWVWCQEIAFPPFAFLLILKSNKKHAGTGLMIGEFTTLAPDKEQYFSGITEVGFGWSPYPGDYRSRAAIEK
jgi:hypothetical protein